MIMQGENKYMLVKVKKGNTLFLNELNFEKEYEIVFIVFMSQNSYIENMNIQNKNCCQYYFLINAHNELEGYCADGFDIINFKLDDDYICSYDIFIKSFVLHPKEIPTHFCWDNIRFPEYTDFDDNFYSRFEHLLI